MTDSQSTEERIKNVAINIFMAKGFAGSRMQDIADAANINKAMLHYYFKNKQKLFELVYKEQFSKFFGALGEIVASAPPFEEKLQLFIKMQIALVSEFPTLPIFVLNEAWQNSSFIETLFSDKPVQKIKNALQKSINEAVERKIIRYISAEELLLNVVSMTVYPIIAKPIIQKILVKSDAQYQKMMNSRASKITDFIMLSLKPL